ncbi:ATP-binding protein [Methylobacterium sp. W2]|uniref:ATP-binding protein n=1 Tax=Methylobacterium sp. W2 TaxID=2598107 RepID=UPI001D0C96DC|nr:ATP-binding protein [Methylobacterium sp. W2]MCC0809414.1 ATP-binding protein [Methylobacterium sp. W2]
MRRDPIADGASPRKRESKVEAAVSHLTGKLRGLADVRSPTDAEEPILGGGVRSSIFGWLAEINAADELAAVGIKPRSTALLSGPPGCGKTTLAHHLSARLGVPLVCVGAENIFGKYLGESEGNIAKLFDTLALADTSAVILIDEIDAIGAKRSDETGGGATSARNSMLTVLLRRIEEFKGVLVAATNRPDSLDPALWRRFGMQIVVDLPDDDARFAILKRYGMPFDFGDDAIEILTDLTDGAAPSLLRQLMEGVKRSLVLGDRIRQPATTAAGTFATIIAQSKPHPDYEPPPLWQNPSLVSKLQDLPWPPKREGV